MSQSFPRIKQSIGILLTVRDGGIFSLVTGAPRPQLYDGASRLRAVCMVLLHALSFFRVCFLMYLISISPYFPSND